MTLPTTIGDELATNPFPALERARHPSPRSAWGMPSEEEVFCRNPSAGKDNF